MKPTKTFSPVRTKRKLSTSNQEQFVLALEHEYNARLNELELKQEYFSSFNSNSKLESSYNAECY